MVSTEVILTQLPLQFKEKLVKMLDKKSRLAIEKTCRELREISHRDPLPRRLNWIRVQLQTGGRASVNVAASNERPRQMDGSIGPLMEYLGHLLSNRNCTVGELTVYPSPDDSASNECFMKAFREQIGSLDHRIHVAELYVSFSGRLQLPLLDILCACRPGALRRLIMGMPSAGGLKEVAATEQWKRARQLHIGGCSREALDGLDKYVHFHDVLIDLADGVVLSAEKIVEMIGFYARDKAKRRGVRVTCHADLDHKAIRTASGVARRAEQEIRDGLFFKHTWAEIQFYTDDYRDDFPIDNPLD